MNDSPTSFISRKIGLPIIGIIILIGLLGLGGWWSVKTTYDLKSTRTELASSTLQFNEKMSALASDLTVSRHENASLTDALRGAQGENSQFADQINNIASTVGTLQKLSKTDPELLKKYSKVYFLNENYIPATLTDIPSEYNSDGRTHSTHTQVLPHLVQMINDAASSSLTIKVVSAYRSFKEQAALKSNYKLTYGSGANKFSADQGYSEHQLGTAVDLTTPKMGGGLVGFDKTPEYEWLITNAYKYGFIISYPKENSYYQFEPWHWRYIGVTLANNLHDENKFFYSLNQREIDSYLVHIFD